MKRGTQRLRFVLEYVERRYTLLAKSVGRLVIERMKQTKGQNKNK